MEEILNHLFRQLLKYSSILLVLVSFSTKAQVTISGQRSGWANKKIKVWKYKDYITHQKHVLYDSIVDSAGKFSIKINTNQIEEVFIQSGGMEGYLFIQPNKNYELALPKYLSKTKADTLNPYYLPYKFYFGIKNGTPTELNHAIAELNAYLDDYLRINFTKDKLEGRKSGIDTLLSYVDSLFSKPNIPFFNSYKKYKLAQIKHVIYLDNINYVIRDNYYNSPIEYNNPAYFELFNNLFDNYLEDYSLTRDGKDIYSNVVKSKSYEKTMKTLHNNLALRNKSLRELVLIKGIHDALYHNYFPQSSLYMLLDSIKLKTDNKNNIQIVNSIIKKTTKLRAGMPPPAVTIKMGDTLNYDIPQKGKKFTLLMFIDVSSFAVQKEIRNMKPILKKFNENLKVVAISVNAPFTKAQDFLKKNNLDILLLNGNNVPHLLEKYSVKAFPTYFLINPEGILSLYPTPGPTEHFEYYFFKILKYRKYKRN